MPSSAHRPRRDRPDRSDPQVAVAPASSPPPDAPVVAPEVAAALRRADQDWVGHDAALPLDPDLGAFQRSSERKGDRYIRSDRAARKGFEHLSPGTLQATLRTGDSGSGWGRILLRLRRTLLGSPLASWQLAHERLTKVKALAVLSSDALSSVAYATEQILVVLVAAGTVAYGYSLPIMGAICALLAIVVLSYRQTISAYRKGGGSYIVASDNLGPIAGLIAGCSLMTSYILTVAVSVSSGVDAIVSAAPSTAGLRVELCVGFVLVLVFGNLRGIRESGSIFAAPTYLFIAGVFLMLGVLTVRLLTGDLHHATPQITHTTQSLGIFLVLRAFASGATALTGVEAISDGVPAFQPPEWKNARRTLTVMGLILGAMFVGITLTTDILGVVALDPTQQGYQTVISQLAHAAFAETPLYLYMAVTTTAILVLAGNTAFADFPRLFYFMARDDYAPHQFGRLGDRLAYSNGILVLGAMATLLVIAFQGDVSRLIPLYAIGVFTAFTMSQAGMVARWLRLREPGWKKGLPVNIVGVTTTGLVFIITGVAKFTQGAWIIVVLVPLLVLLCRGIHRHYTETKARIAAEEAVAPAEVQTVCVVPIADLNPLALQTLAIARSFSPAVVAVHVNDNEAEIESLRARWAIWGNHVPLEVIKSPYRSLLRPLLRYVDGLDRLRTGDTVVVVLPELVATRWWHHLLHNQSALRLKAALLFRPGTVVVSVPYHLPSSRRLSRRARGLDI